ncbi:MAG TPA: hypothetical protein PKC45_07410 [Gemmatales bacterium]|nr:hypothetical protein [Gemmatales bacterium]
MPAPAPAAKPAAAPPAAPPPPSLDLKALEGMLDPALKAYNDGAFKPFFTDFAKKAERITTEAVFQMLYGEETKGKFGKFVKRLELIKDKSVLEGEVLLAQWWVEFEKIKKARLICNLTHEEGKYRFLSIAFEPS